VKSNIASSTTSANVTGRLCFVKKKIMHMPKILKQNNLVKPQKDSKKTDVWLVDVVTNGLEAFVFLDQSNWGAIEAPRQDRWQLREPAGMYAGACRFLKRI
jgi:hypothetical protein